MLSPHQSLYEIFHVKDIQTMWKYVSFLLFIEYVHTYTDPFVQMKSVLTMENHGGFQQKNRNTCWDIIPIYLLMIKLSATKVYG